MTMMMCDTVIWTIFFVDTLLPILSLRIVHINYLREHHFSLLLSILKHKIQDVVSISITLQPVSLDCVEGYHAQREGCSYLVSLLTRLSSN